MFCRNGLSRYPAVRRVSIPSNARPPNSTRHRDEQDRRQDPRSVRHRSASVVSLQHLQPAHSQLIDLQFPDAQPAYSRIADPQPPDRQDHCDGAHCRGSGRGSDDSDDFRFYGTGSADGAGFALSRSGGVVAGSHVFAGSSDLVTVWSDLIIVGGLTYPGLDLVGYELGADLQAALVAGFAGIGPLRVWMR